MAATILARSKTPTQRFEEKITVTPGCWIWNGYKRHDGYGQMRYEGQALGAHRVSYLLYNGEIPEGLMVCHECDNPGCVNPDHLVVGTGSKNIIDAYARGCAPARALTIDKARKIIEMRKQGVLYRIIEEEFGISRGTIHSIVFKKIWKRAHED